MMPPNNPTNYPEQNQFHDAQQHQHQQQQHQQLQQQQQQQQQQPNPISNFAIDTNDVSFEPVDAGYVGTGTMDNSFSQQQQQQQQQQQTQPSPGTDATNGGGGRGCLQAVKSCFSMPNFQEHFDVDTEDIKERVVGSLTFAHVPDHFLERILKKEGKRADLYGPFWICMTLVMFLAVTANTAKFLHRNETVNDIEFDINHLFHSFNIFFLFAFALPTVLYFIIHCLVRNQSQPQPISLIDIIALYGYSLVPYIFATILCLVPSTFVEWVALAAATGLSLLLIIRNITGPLVRNVQADGGGVAGRGEKLVGSFLMLVVGCHIVLFFVMKFLFYRHRGGGVVPGSGVDDMAGAVDYSSGAADNSSGAVDYSTDAAENSSGVEDGGIDNYYAAGEDDDGDGVRWF